MVTTPPAQVYSLSKQSNLRLPGRVRGGDPDLVANLVNSRKHAGMIVPAPVQSARRWRWPTTPMWRRRRTGTGRRTC